MSTTIPIDPARRKRFDRESIDETPDREEEPTKMAPGVAALIWILVAMGVGIMVFEMSAFG